MDDICWIFAFNLIVNSFLVFVTTAFLIQLILSFSRIKWPRLQALFLSLPFFKLGLDPFLYNFQNWALLFQNDPLNVETNSRTLSVSFICAPSAADQLPLSTSIRLSLDNGQTFSLADMLALQLPSFMLKRLIVSMVLVSMIMLGYYLKQLIESVRIIAKIKKHATRCDRVVKNKKLLEQLKNVCLIESQHISIPCAFGVFSKKICFPSQLLNKLTQEEFEAIVAHEVNHLHWYDGVVRVILIFLANMFWWVPTRWWISRIDSAHEKACDASIYRYNIDRLNLASALLRTVSTRKDQVESPLFSASFVKKTLMVKRLELLLDSSFGRTRKFSSIQAVILGLIALVLLNGRFWLF